MGHYGHGMVLLPVKSAPDLQMIKSL